MTVMYLYIYNKDGMKKLVNSSEKLRIEFLETFGIELSLLRLSTKEAKEMQYIIKKIEIEGIEEIEI